MGFGFHGLSKLCYNKLIDSKIQGDAFMENIIITGHKNPDTDSICSALSYTWIKTQLGKGHRMPGRQSEPGNPVCAGPLEVAAPDWWKR